MDGDPFIRAREALISDVATFAHHRYKAVIVFDRAGNVNPERSDRSRAGVKLIFSKPNQSADTVIETSYGRGKPVGPFLLSLPIRTFAQRLGLVPVVTHFKCGICA